MRNMLSSNSVFIVRSLKSLLFIVGPPKSQQISAEMHLVVWLEALKKVEMSGDTLRQKIGWNKTWIALLRTWQQKIEGQVVDSCSRIDNCHYHFHCKHVNNWPRDRLKIGFVIVLVLIIIVDHYHYHCQCNCHCKHGNKRLRSGSWIPAAGLTIQRTVKWGREIVRRDNDYDNMNSCQLDVDWRHWHFGMFCISAIFRRDNLLNGVCLLTTPFSWCQVHSDPERTR